MWDDEAYRSFWGHVEDLRKTLLRMGLVVAMGFTVILFFYQPILAYFTPQTRSSLNRLTVQQERLSNSTQGPQFYHLAENEKVLDLDKAFYLNDRKGYQIESGGYIDIHRLTVNKLLILSPIEGFTLTLKLCFWISLALTSPFWIYILLQFILPGLNSHEKKFVFPFIAGSFLAMIGGISLAYYVTLPLANQYLGAFNAEIGLNAWTMAYYVDYTLVLLMGHIVAFEVCLLLLFLVHFQVLSAAWLCNKRRYMYVLAFLLGALLTPPDVLTQLMLAFPLIGIYELTILYGKWRARHISNKIGRMSRITLYR